jgi:two-component system CheB/CheR fusion protein
MQQVGVTTYVEYIDHLEVHPEEFAQLFNTILINVTAFFRDRAAWDYLQSEVIPSILATKSNGEPIRVWTAGVASGQEAYSVAILLIEALGEEQYFQRVKIYATDIDEAALIQARQASYDGNEVEDIPPELLAKYFEPVGTQFVFRKDLRRAIIFGRHDLLQDAPISRIDLLVCRNTLMYFNAEAQTRILGHLHYALAETGFLFLGKSEMLLTHGNLFIPVDLKRRFFRKVVRPSFRDRLARLGQYNHNHDEIPSSGGSGRLREAAFDVSPIAQVVLDAEGHLALINQAARTAFGLTSNDLGRLIQDLQVSYRPVELRSLIDRAFAERRTFTVRDAGLALANDEHRYYDVQVIPLFGPTNTRVGVSLSFANVTEHKHLQETLHRANQELETAYEELQAANEELQTTNEELQSTNEELETTNEELQSTNEELETMNEELQSTNEELQAANEELRQRTDELNQVNGFLESILTSLQVGVVVLNRELRIQAWNSGATDLWGLRAEEAEGENFLSLDIGLPVAQLNGPIRPILSGEATGGEVTLAATNRRGRSIQVKVTLAPLVGTGGKQPEGVILLTEEVRNDGAHPGAMAGG